MRATPQRGRASAAPAAASTRTSRSTARCWPRPTPPPLRAAIPIPSPQRSRTDPMPGRAAPARAVFAWLLLVAGVSSVVPTHAGDLQVAPILIEIAADEQSQALTLSNTGDTPLRAQIRVMDWRQADGGEDFAPTRLLRASPPIVEIAPHSRQLIRIVRPDNTPPATELAYRLIVDELPDPGKAEVAGLKLLLRYSIPVFVLPPGVVPVLARTGTIPPTDLSTVSASLGNGVLDVG